MSLESAIKDLTEAVKENTAAVLGGKPTKDAVSAVIAKREAAKAETKAKVVESTISEGTTGKPTETTADATGPVSYETVRASLGAVISKFGKAAGVAVFEQSGVKDPKADLAGDDKADLRAKVNKALLARAAASE